MGVTSCKQACKPKPALTLFGTIQQPKAAAVRNTHGERDLTDDDNWQDVETIRFALRQRRASEIIAVDQVEGIRFVEIGTWGTATTRLAADSPSWRLVYTDRDGRTHALNFEPGRIEDDGRWVTIPAQEKV